MSQQGDEKVANALPEVGIMTKHANVLGAGLIDIVTTGMYSDPRMVIREYVQNACDSIEAALKDGIVSESEAHIDISLFPDNRSIEVIDNGMGMTQTEAASLLASIAVSSKGAQLSRGFRGIGRLGGLGYCDSLVFETRAPKDDSIISITWKRRSLEAIRSSSHALSSALQKCTEMIARKAMKQDPKHFFRVVMKGVESFGDDTFFDEASLYHYLSQVVPAAFDQQAFSFAPVVMEHLSAIPGTRSFNIFLNGREVKKQYNDLIKIRGDRTDAVSSIALFELKDGDNGIFARGWYAKTNYLASLSKLSGVAGIRFRQGNIAIGDERAMSPYFLEPRFAAWHIGEIHFDYRMKLNARRDDFERTALYEKGIEQLAQLGRHLGYLIRSASNHRTEAQNTTSLLRQSALFIESSYLFTSSAQHNIASALLARLASASSKLDKSAYAKTTEDQLSSLVANPADLQHSLDGRKARHKKPFEIISEVVRAIEGLDIPIDNKILILRAILEPYLR